MNIVNIFNIAVAWAHLISATAWVGGSIFWLIVLTPSIQKIPSNHKTEILRSISHEFKSVVDTSMFILLFTGAILTFNKITPGHIGTLYVLILGIKILLAITSEEISSLIENLRSGYPYKGSLIDFLKIQSTENRDKTNTKYFLSKNGFMDKLLHKNFVTNIFSLWNYNS